MSLHFPVDPIDAQKTFGFKQADAKSDLDMETFLRLLTVQLANQNPLEPMSDRDFFAQMAQLGTVQGMDALKASADSQHAHSLIGKTVTALRPFTETGSSFDTYVTGMVRQVTERNGELILSIEDLDGGFVEVKMDQIKDVYEIDPPEHLVGGEAALSLIGKEVKVSVPELDAEGNPLKDQDGNVVMREVVGDVTRVFVKDGRRHIEVSPPATEDDPNPTPVEARPEDVIQVSTGR